MTAIIKRVKQIVTRTQNAVNGIMARRWNEGWAHQRSHYLQQIGITHPDSLSTLINRHYETLSPALRRKLERKVHATAR